MSQYRYDPATGNIFPDPDYPEIRQYLVQLNSLIQDWAIYCMDSADDFDGDRYVSPIESVLMDIAHSVGLDWGDICRLTYDERHKEADEMTELKPCPFCGCDKHPLTFHYGHMMPRPWRAECFNCGCAAPWASTEKEALDLWNRRVKE